MMISVIIPIYNVEKYLKRCIDSVLKSTYRDFEILLVNDGSEDGSREICKAYLKKDSRVRYFEQENKGVSAARNKGIEESRGEWIIFVDGDDFITCDFLSTVARKEYQQYDMIIFDYILLKKGVEESPGETPVFKSSGSCYYGKEEQLLLTEKLLNAEQLVENGRTTLRSPWAKAFKHSIICENHFCFPIGIVIGEDTLFNIEYIQKADSCLYVQKSVYFYVIRSDSAVHGDNINYLKNDIAYRKCMISILEKYGIFQQVHKAYYNNVLYGIADILIKRIFNPYNGRAFKEQCGLCCRMHEIDLYVEALNYSSKMGGFSRRILLFSFKIKCFRIVKLICNICYKILEKRDSMWR